MMPTCQYKGCKKVADHTMGKIWDCDTNDRWENPFYLCKKHAKKILKELGIEYKGEEE